MYLPFTMSNNVHFQTTTLLSLLVPNQIPQAPMVSFVPYRPLPLRLVIKMLAEPTYLPNLLLSRCLSTDSFMASGSNAG